MDNDKSQGMNRPSVPPNAAVPGGRQVEIGRRSESVEAGHTGPPPTTTSEAKPSAPPPKKS